jgi:Bacterial TniB protein
MQVVALQMPPEPDEKSFYTQLLSSLKAPARTSMNVHQMRHVASVITLKPAIRYQFKTGQRDWPKT